MAVEPHGQTTHAAYTTPTQYYYGTIGPAMPGAMIALGFCAWPDAEAVLDAGGPPGAAHRSTAVRAAFSVKDATAIAAIYTYSRTAPVPHDAIHVYRVQLTPFHVGPVALVEELQDRLATGSGRILSEPLIQEYWEPTGTWYVQEILARSVTVLEEVPATCERDVYVRRWVHYHRDGERARSL